MQKILAENILPVEEDRSLDIDLKLLLNHIRTREWKLYDNS
jgi:hypothetical protein